MKSLLLFVLPIYLGFVQSCPHHSLPADNTADYFVRRSTPSPLGKTAIINARVFDGVCFSPPRTIVIDQDRISTDETNVTTVVNAMGQFLIPGLIDNHIHTGSIQGLENATSYGITTAMNMACNNYTVCALLKKQDGLADFMTASFPAMGANSTHANAGHVPTAKLVTDQSNALDLATWAVGNGSDLYKITLEVNGPSYNLTRRLISAVHGLGQQTRSHASDIGAYTQAIDTGIDGIQHTPDDGNLTMEMIRQIRQNKQFVTPTMTVHSFLLNPPNPAALTLIRGKPGAGNSSWTNVVNNVRAMYRAGVPLLAGTDAAGPITASLMLPYGATLHQELQFFVNNIGMAPAEAINAATREAARYHRLGDRGEIKRGMRVDLVLLGSNPLDDIQNTMDIVGVWAAGRRFS